MPSTPAEASEPVNEPEPRWPAVLAVLAVGALQLMLPEQLSIGPGWLLLVLVVLLTVPTIIARRLGYFRLNEFFGYSTSGLVTLMLIWSLFRLIVTLPAHRETPVELLRSAATLWFSNILIFATWYWRLDAGGPNARDLRDVHTEGAFLFPQMTIPALQTIDGARGWAPGFVDYLFLAFNTSTAFSPTDVPVLSRWAKLIMMVQAMISLATITLLAARAVNIL
ncbi:MAG TPA: hypothetical protein VGD62_07650 [Acidobacteriaceae bacterium]